MIDQLKRSAYHCLLTVIVTSGLKILFRAPVTNCALFYLE